MEHLPNTQKLVIRAFEDKRFSKEVNAGAPYMLPINPEQMQQNLRVRYDTSQGQGTQGASPNYSGTQAPDFRIEILMDNTGAIYGNIYEGVPVIAQVQAFLETVYKMEGNMHQPRYLKLIWGANFTFDCLLTNLDIQYSIYDRHGAPLRAKLNATFVHHIEHELRVRVEGKRSPDLTHYRQVEPGDDLPLMTYSVYGNKLLYLQVAKANDMTNFRKLKTGENVIFPPIKKNTANAGKN
jgi:hypothetical protein